MPDLKRPNPDDSTALVLAKKSRNEVVLAKVHNAGALIKSVRLHELNHCSSVGRLTKCFITYVVQLIGNNYMKSHTNASNTFLGLVTQLLDS
jgi:Na+-transporting NADH:ubiquinone oxidoreductase subunit NqrE